MKNITIILYFKIVSNICSWYMPNILSCYHVINTKIIMDLHTFIG